MSQTLTGWPYAGLRKMLRERFDRIEVIDLRGDVRRGERAGVDADQGVFNIMVGTAITLAIADGSKAPGTAAAVRYYDTWTEGLFTRRAKLDWLRAGAGGEVVPDFVAVERDALEDMRPKPFQNGEWLSLREAFVFSKSGMKSGDDEIYVSVVRVELREQVARVLNNGARGAYDAALEPPYSYRPSTEGGSTTACVVRGQRFNGRGAAPASVSTPCLEARARGRPSGATGSCLTTTGSAAAMVVTPSRFTTGAPMSMRRTFLRGSSRA